MCPGKIGALMSIEEGGVLGGDLDKLKNKSLSRWGFDLLRLLGIIKWIG